MIGINAEFALKEGKDEEFVDVASQLVEAVNANEPGCKLYTLV